MTDLLNKRFSGHIRENADKRQILQRCLLSCQFLLIRHCWLRYTGAKLLSCLRRCHKPSRIPKEPPDSFLDPFTKGLCMIRSVASSSAKFLSPGEVPECFQLNLNHILTQWTLCFAALAHPQWIKTVIIPSNHGHWNCSKDPLQDPPVVISLQSSIFLSILSLSFFSLHIAAINFSLSTKGHAHIPSSSQ